MPSLSDKSQKALNLFKSELEKGYNLGILSFDEDFYLLDLIVNVSQLEKSFKDKRTSSLIADTTSLGNVKFDLDYEKLSIEGNRINIDDIIERYILDEVMSQWKRGSIESLKSIVNKNNNFALGVFDYVNESSKTNAVATILGIDLSDLEGGSDDLVYKFCLVESSNLTLVVTEGQMQFKTSFGVVKIHDEYHDVDYNDLLLFLSKFLRVNKNEIGKLV